MPVDLDALSPAMLATDVIASPAHRVLGETEEWGCPTVDGREMLAK